MQMSAKKSFRYAQRTLKPGETFEARDKDVRFLRAARLASEVEATIPVAPLSEPKPVEQAAEQADKPKRRYKRRDMQAED